MIKNFLKGIAIGIANVLPGVSGGTLAVVLNIYDKLTEAIGNFFIATKEKKIEYIKFLSQIGLGAVAGVLVFAKVITYLYGNYPKMTTLGFLILIIPSIPLILKGEKVTDKKNILFLILGIIFTTIFMYSMAKISNGLEVNSNAVSVERAMDLTYGIKLFVCGMIAAGAMVIPGISGSLLLMILGEYYNILSYITNIKIIPLVVFSIGVLIGLVGVSKGINILLKRYRSYTLNFIVGIIIVSLFEIAKNLF